jgi:hemolysin activation/secretion protein
MSKLFPCLTFIASVLLFHITPDAQAQLPSFRERPDQQELLQPLKPKQNPLQLEPSNPDTTPQERFPTLKAKEFIFIGNTAISTATLTKIVEPFIEKDINFSDLINIRNQISKFYIDQGYINSGAQILTADNQKLNLKAATITIRIIEGGIEKVTINGSRRLKSYVLSQINPRKNIFNVNTLIDRLRILDDNPLLNKINATLEKTDNINTSNLIINVKPSNPYNIEIFTNNYRNSSVGTFERGIDFTALNPLGRGDRVDVTYSNTNGSNSLQTTYRIPINSQNTTLNFDYSFGQNSTIAFPFDSLDIKGSSQSYHLGVRHPIFRSASESSRSELNLGFEVTHREIQDSILGFNFPISRGADENGRTRTTILSLVKDWQYQDSVQAATLKSNLGLGINIASVTDPLFDKGQFVAWQIDASWTRKLPWNLLLTSRLRFQLVDRPVVAAEQFSLGGYGSIMGYRQDALLGDNGILGSLEIKIPLYQGNLGTLSLSPFIGSGHIWNDPRLSTPTQTIASLGLGFQYDFSDTLSANLAWGFPLLDISSGANKSLQDNGFLLGVRWRLF